MSYLDRVSSPGPKKLLALDGGGIRGVITLEVLLRLESMLAEQHGSRKDFVLADYFDYIGGTSTGAVIAAGLAKGLPVGELLDFYVTRGQDMFDKASLLRQFNYRYGSERLRGMLQEILGTTTLLGSEDLGRAVDGDAQCDDGLPVAAEQQPPRPLQRPGQARQQPEHPAVATGPGEHRRPGVLPAGGGHSRRP